MAGNAEGFPRYMEPAGAGEELVGILTCLKERDELLELLRILGADVGGLALQVLGVLDTTHAAVDLGIAEAGVDDDGFFMSCHVERPICHVERSRDIS